MRNLWDRLKHDYKTNLEKERQYFGATVLHLERTLQSLKLKDDISIADAMTLWTHTGNEAFTFDVYKFFTLFEDN